MTTITGYGLALARTVRFPPSILPRAEAIYDYLLHNNTLAEWPAPSAPFPPINVPLRRARSSNPISRTYALSERSPSISSRRHRPDAQQDVSDDLRGLYDLYANVMEVIRSPADGVGLEDSLNACLEQFMVNCGSEMELALSTQSVEELMGRFFPNQPSEAASSKVIVNVNSKPSGDRSVTFSENVSIREIEAFPNEFSQRQLFSNDIVQRQPFPIASTSSRNTTHNWSDHSLISNLNHRKRLMNPGRFGTSHQCSKDVTNQWIQPQNEPHRDQVDVSNQRIQPQNEAPNRNRAIPAVTNQWIQPQKEVTSRNRAVPAVNNLLIQRRIPSDTETNMSRPSFKSFMREFGYAKPPQIAPNAMPSAGTSYSVHDSVYLPRQIGYRALPSTAHHQATIPPPELLSQRPKTKPVQPLKEVNYFPDSLAPKAIPSAGTSYSIHDSVYHPPQIDYRSMPSTEHHQATIPLIPPPLPQPKAKPVPARKEDDYYPDMPDEFWQSLAEFESGNEYQELRDFINEGMPHPDIMSVFEPTQQCPEIMSISSSHSERPRRSVRFADEQPAVIPPLDNHRATDLEHFSNASKSIGTPNIFEGLDNYMMGGNFSQDDPWAASPSPKRARVGDADLIDSRPPLNDLFSQNTFNFMVEFESTLSDKSKQTMDGINDEEPKFGSNLEEATQPPYCPMELDDPEHGTQSRDTESSFNEMDPTQHVIAILSQTSSCHNQDEEDMFNDLEPASSFEFKIPVEQNRPSLSSSLSSLLGPYPAIFRSPTQSENLHRMDQYLTSQYERAIVNPAPSSSANTMLTPPGIIRPAPSEQFAKTHSISHSATPSPWHPVGGSSQMRSDDSPFCTPQNQNIRQHLGLTSARIADSLRRYIDSNRDSDDEEDMFASSSRQTASQIGQQVALEDDEMVQPDSSMVEIIIPAPEEFQ